MKVHANRDKAIRGVCLLLYMVSPLQAAVITKAHYVVSSTNVGGSSVQPKQVNTLIFRPVFYSIAPTQPILFAPTY
jgi:hypothetical protein